MFGISRQAFYQKQQREARRLNELEQVKTFVVNERRIMPRLGTRKLHYLITDEVKSLGIKIGRDALFDFLRSEHLLVKPRKNYTKTTMSKHWLHKHPNLLKTMKPSRSEEVWVSDITHVNKASANSPFRQRFAVLCWKLPGNIKKRRNNTKHD